MTTPIPSSPERVSSVPDGDLSLFMLFDEIAGNDDPAKEKLMALKEATEKEGIPNLSEYLSLEFPEGEALSEFLAQKIENPEAQKILNGVGIACAVGILETLEGANPEEREALLEKLKAGDVIVLSEGMDPRVSQAFAIVQSARGSTAEASAGSAIAQNFDGFVDTAGAVFTEAEASAGTWEGTLGGMAGSIATSGAMMMLNFTPMGRIVGSVGGMFAGNALGTEAHNMRTGEDKKNFFERTGASVRSGVEWMQNGLTDGLREYGVSEERAQAVGKYAPIIAGGVLAAGIVLWNMFSDDEKTTDPAGKQVMGMGKRLALGALAMVGIPLLWNVVKGLDITKLLPKEAQDAIEKGRQMLDKGKEAYDTADEARKRWTTENLAWLKEHGIPYTDEVATFLNSQEMYALLGGASLSAIALWKGRKMLSFLWKVKKILGVTVALYFGYEVFKFFNDKDKGSTLLGKPGDDENNFIEAGLEMLGVSEIAETISNGVHHFWEGYLLPLYTLWDEKGMFDMLDTIGIDLKEKFLRYKEDPKVLETDFMDWMKKEGSTDIMKTAGYISEGLAVFYLFKFVRKAFFRTIFRPDLIKALGFMAAGATFISIADKGDLPFSSRQIENFMSGCRETMGLTESYCSALLNDPENEAKVKEILEGSETEEALIPREFQRLFGYFFADEILSEQERQKNIPEVRNFLANVSGEEGLEAELSAALSEQLQFLEKGERFSSKNWRKIRVMAESCGWSVSVEDGAEADQFITSFEKGGVRHTVILHHNVCPDAPTKRELRRGIREGIVEAVEEVGEYMTTTDDMNLTPEERMQLQPLHERMRQIFSEIEAKGKDEKEDPILIASSYISEMQTILGKRNTLLHREEDKVFLEEVNGVLVFHFGKDEMLPFVPQGGSVEALQEAIRISNEEERGNLENLGTNTTENFRTFLSWQLRRYADDTSEKGKDMREMLVEYLSEDISLLDAVEIVQIMYKMMTIDDSLVMNVLDTGIVLTGALGSLAIGSGEMVYDALLHSFQEGFNVKDTVAIGAGTVLTYGAGKFTLKVASGKAIFEVPAYAMSKAIGGVKRIFGEKVLFNRMQSNVNVGRYMVDLAYSRIIYGWKQGGKVARALATARSNESMIKILEAEKAALSYSPEGGSAYQNKQSEIIRYQKDVKNARSRAWRARRFSIVRRGRDVASVGGHVVEGARAAIASPGARLAGEVIEHAAPFAVAGVSGWMITEKVQEYFEDQEKYGWKVAKYDIAQASIYGVDAVAGGVITGAMIAKKLGNTGLAVARFAKLNPYYLAASLLIEPAIAMYDAQKEKNMTAEDFLATDGGIEDLKLKILSSTDKGFYDTMKYLLTSPEQLVQIRTFQWTALLSKALGIDNSSSPNEEQIQNLFYAMEYVRSRTGGTFLGQNASYISNLFDEAILFSRGISIYMVSQKVSFEDVTKKDTNGKSQIDNLLERESQIQELIGGVDEGVKKSLLEKYKEKRAKNIFLAAVYRVGQEVFLYDGDPSDEQSLQYFFSEETKEIHGIYYDRNNERWYVNEGWGNDDPLTGKRSNMVIPFEALRKLKARTKDMIPEKYGGEAVAQKIYAAFAKGPSSVGEETFISKPREKNTPLSEKIVPKEESVAPQENASEIPLAA